jgi:hypothetical protein
MDNDMDISPEDEKLVELISKLKKSNGGYPSDMLAARREAYLKQVANVGLGIGVGNVLKNGAKTGNGAGASATIASKILETTLVAAIAIEAGTAAYLYRDKIADAVKTYTNSAKIQEVAPPSEAAVVEVIEPTISLTSTPSGTPSVTASWTLPPNLAGNNDDGDTGVNANSTPNPNGNNGNHFGQTPKPVRTKDNINDTITGGGGNNKNKP